MMVANAPSMVQSKRSVLSRVLVAVLSSVGYGVHVWHVDLWCDSKRARRSKQKHSCSSQMHVSTSWFPCEGRAAHLILLAVPFLYTCSTSKAQRWVSTWAGANIFVTQSVLEAGRVGRNNEQCVEMAVAEDPGNV